MAEMRGEGTNDSFTSCPSREKQENWDWERRRSPASFYGSCLMVNASLFCHCVFECVLESSGAENPSRVCWIVSKIYVCFHQTHIWQHGFACMCICFYWHVSPAFVYISIYLCMWAPASKHICLLSGTRFNVLLGGPFVSCHEDPKTVWLTQFSSNFNINHSRVQ